MRQQREAMARWRARPQHKTPQPVSPAVPRGLSVGAIVAPGEEASCWRDVNTHTPSDTRGRLTTSEMCSQGENTREHERQRDLREVGGRLRDAQMTKLLPEDLVSLWGLSQSNEQRERRPGQPVKGSGGVPIEREIEKKMRKKKRDSALGSGWLRVAVDMDLCQKTYNVVQNMRCPAGGSSRDAPSMPCYLLTTFIGHC